MKKIIIMAIMTIIIAYPIKGIDANLVSYYEMGNLQDKMGRANLTLYNSPENLTGGNCLNGLCSRLHGSGSSSSTPFDSYSTYATTYGSYINTTTDICLDFYFNGTIQSGGYNQIIIGGSGASRSHYVLAIQTASANQFIGVYTDGTGGTQSSALTINTSAGYHYYAFCRTGNRFLIYEDASLKVNSTGTARNPTGPFMLTFAGNEPGGGSTYGHSSSYLAMYDEVGVWNTLLTYNDILVRAAKTTSSYYPFTTANTLDTTKYNFTSGYTGTDQITWRTNTSYRALTYDNTPTLYAETTLNGNCTIGIYDLNYTSTIINGSYSNCSETDSKTHTCTYGGGFSEGNNTIYLSCTGMSGNTSLSGALPIYVNILNLRTKRLVLSDATLEVPGIIQTQGLDQPLVCDVATESYQYYNYDTHKMVYCNSTAWVSI